MKKKEQSVGQGRGGSSRRGQGEEKETKETEK